MLSLTWGEFPSRLFSVVGAESSITAPVSTTEKDDVTNWCKRRRVRDVPTGAFGQSLPLKPGEDGFFLAAIAASDVIYAGPRPVPDLQRALGLLKLARAASSATVKGERMSDSDGCFFE